MKSAFDITTTTEQITADNGKATMVFTVTNTSSKGVRGVAKIKPLDNTQRDWLKLEGESERDFSANGTQQFTVNFNKPEVEAAAKEESKEETKEETKETQSFPYRLDVISSINPDEDFTEGPTVTVEMPEEKKDDEPKPFPIWIPIVAGVLLLAIIGGVVGYLLTRDSKVQVPPVVEMSFEKAQTTIEQSGLKAEKHEDNVNLNNKINIVFDQNPNAGEEVAANSIVKLSVPATTIVPDLTGRPLDQAINLLLESDLRLGSIKGNEGNLKIIRSQSPAVNDKRPVVKKTKVSICFSLKRTDCVLIKPGLVLEGLNVAPNIKEEIMKSFENPSLVSPKLDTIRELNPRQ